MDAERKKSDANQPATVPGTVRNIGDPILFNRIEPLCGFVAEPARGGETVKVWTRLAMTSDEPLFHRIVEGLAGAINHMAQQAGTPVQLNRADTVLLVMKPDNTAELWLDTAAVAIRCAVKRAMTAGSVVFEHDIADVVGMTFPCVNFGLADRVLCLFRQDWRFGLAFDFNPEGKLDIESFTTSLGTLYRSLRYRHLYEALADKAVFERLLRAGWFPFVEIIVSEFKTVLRSCEAGFDMAAAEEMVVAKFDEPRLDRMLDRWIAKPHFQSKHTILKAAIDAYKRREPVAVIKILLTEIEGVLSDAYRASHGGQGARLTDLLKFAIDAAEKKAGQPDTLLFPASFAQYLVEYTFAKFDPRGGQVTSVSRHVIGHGAATQEAYTMVRALQAILTLDQLAFYT